MKRRDFLGSLRAAVRRWRRVARADAADGDAAQVRRYTRVAARRHPRRADPARRARRRDELRVPVSVRGDAVLPAAAGRSRVAPVARVASRARRSVRVRPAASARRATSCRSRRSARTSSPIRRATCRSSAISGRARRRRRGSVIHCCADHSVYDPAAGARVVAGPAPQPLAGDRARARRGARRARARSARSAPSSSRRSSRSTRSSSRSNTAALERAQQPVADTTVVRELTNYCRNTIEC